MTRRPLSSKSDGATILLIGAFKLLKGVLLLAVAIGALRLLHKDIAATVNHWVQILRVDPDSHYIHGLMVRVLRVNGKELKAISAGTFFYSAILLTEGVGLLMRKHWAEYFTIISTAALIPLEVYELYRGFTWTKIAVFAINIAIVVYLAMRVRRR